MAHECPECGMDCDCCGDIDDASVMTPAWVLENCCHECDEVDEGYIEDIDDDDWEDYDAGYATPPWRVP